MGGGTLYRAVGEMKKTIFTAMALILLLSGCSWFQTREEASSEDLVSDGMYNYESGKYMQAIESFEKLKDWYPYSKYAILAELKTADAYYRLGKYDEAVAAYEAFESLHPRNEAIPYIIYQIGTCYFEQIDTVDRDQRSAEKALEGYMRLLRQFPNDPYAHKARQNIKVCQRSLAGHEFYVGLFYFKSGHYRPALKRFKSVLSNYPDVGIHQNALRYITLCENELIENPKADETETGGEVETLEPETAGVWP
jgi:outer membrane protein assembly factor BamD